MNRRKAIGRIVITGIGGALALSGYKWHEWYKAPDFSFLEQQDVLIGALADTILPSTPDSPGAAEAQVTPFIIHMVKHCIDRASANRFIDGLQDVDAWSRHRYGRPFPECRAQERATALEHFARRDQPLSGIAGKIQKKLTGKPFFSTLRDCTVIAYCTSEQGATRGLSYVLIPGSYQGCIPKSPGQRAWATK
jgi:hypothetical protein